MEELLQKLNNHMSRKRIDYIEINGVVDKSGVLKQRFTETFSYDEDRDYMVSLLSAEMSSFFPNIIKDVNNMFYYKKDGGAEQEITLDSGAYDIEDLSKIIQYRTQEGIKIDIEPGTGRSQVYLKPGYVVTLKENSPNKILGYPDGVQELRNTINTSPNMCDVIKTNKIYISLDVIEGSNFKGNKSRILLSFPNKEDWGMPIFVEPRYKQKKKLVQKQFSALTFSFHNENNEPIDFLSSPISMTLEIAEV